MVFTAVTRTALTAKCQVYPRVGRASLPLYSVCVVPNYFLLIKNRIFYARSCRDAFVEVLQTRRREHLFVEVVLIQGMNDSPELARALAALLRPLPNRASINLLPYNDTGHAVFRASTPEAVEEFQRVLTEEGFVATIRTAR